MQKKEREENDGEGEGEEGGGEERLVAVCCMLLLYAVCRDPTGKSPILLLAGREIIPHHSLLINKIVPH